MESKYLAQSLVPYKEKDKELLIGSHISFKKPDYFLDSVKEALRIKASSFMIFLGAPNNTVRFPIKNMKFDEGKELWRRNGLDIKNVAVHFPYIINPASPDEEKAQFSLNFIEDELDRMEEAGLTLMCLHPGSSKDKDRMEYTKVLADRLKPIFVKHPKIKCSLENMAGGGSQLNVGLNEAKMFVEYIGLDNFGITIDSCHLWDSGEDFTDTQGLLYRIEKTIGFNKVFLIHLNDSLNPRGSKNDRHANIGKGMIGEANLLRFALNKHFKDVPKILETPETRNGDEHKKEIEEIRFLEN